MARVSSDRVLLVDTLHMGDDVEEAEKLRDPSHVRNYTEAEWRGFVEETGLADRRARASRAPDRLRSLARAHRLRGRDGGARSSELLGDRVADGRLTLDKIAIRAVKGH